MTEDETGWTLDGAFAAPTGHLRLRIPADVNIFYESQGTRTTANQWAVSLREEASARTR